MRIPLDRAFPRIAAAFFFAAFVIHLSAAEVMPPAPTAYFNDFAGVIQPVVRDQLNQKLEQFERDSSCQVVVAVYPRMQSDSSIEDYVNRMFRELKIGQARTNNGVLLAVFIQDRKMRIEVGYGLEGAIPDAIAKRIIAEEITPHFKSGDYTAGLSAGVDAIIKAARGEYRGSGRTVADAGGTSRRITPFLLFFGLVAFLMIFQMLSRAWRGTVYGRRGHSTWGGFPVGGGWGGGGGGGGWSGGGGFSGGGGSSGGGGASGSW